MTTSNTSPGSSRSFGGIFDVDRNRSRITELERLAAGQDFWSRPEKAQATLKETAKLKRVVDTWDQQRAVMEEAEVMLTLAEEEKDAAMITEAEAQLATVEQAIERIEFERMLSGEMDPSSALVSINAGAGGVDARDWAGMLQRMYMRWAQRKGFKIEIIDYQPDVEAGINSCEMLIEGEYAYGFLKAEAGVHRLVRISPFDGNARRQTSFAAVFVYPDIDETIHVDIKDDDLRIDVFRSSGAGGQHVNKTESAVRITHLPTNIVVQCQNERSQHKNKETAFRMLRSRLYELAEREKEERMGDINKKKMKIDFGSQIRSYVLAPYRLVSDLRTEIKVGNVDAVLDGDIDVFIENYLLKMGTENVQL